MQTEKKDLPAQYFLSALSHELRTPLNGIVGYTQLLLSTKLDNNQRGYLNSMNHCCIQLVELINDILDFSKLSTGKGQVVEECFAFKEIIEEIDSAIGYKITEKKQKLRYALHKDLPEYIVSDKQKLIQILINLISNANKFTPAQGRIIVSINPKDTNSLEFSVEDNGIGIALEDQEKLFHPFVQLGDGTAKGGCGLGLAISKKLAELLNGNMTVTSEKGQGAIFTFFIEYKKYENFEKIIETKGAILNNKYILVVDDNIESRLVLGEILFDYKMRPVICSSGKEALHMVNGKRYAFAAILIDISIQDMAGSDLAKKLKEKDSELPLVALTSISEHFDTSNFSQVLYKPVNKLKLLDTLCKIAGKNDINACELNPTEEKNEAKLPEIRILIAEDNIYSSEMLIKMLDNMGYKSIDKAMDGQEAIDKLENNTYDILLLDLKMPRKTGFDVLEYIRGKKYDLKVAVITASVLENDKEKCRELGAKYFLIKPFNMNHLKSIIHRMIYGSKKIF